MTGVLPCNTISTQRLSKMSLCPTVRCFPVAFFGSQSCACDGIPAQGGLFCVELKIGKKRLSKSISVKFCMFKALLHLETINGEDHNCQDPLIFFAANLQAHRPLSLIHTLLRGKETSNLPSIRPFIHVSLHLPAAL